jgi:cytochrome c peroxidase
MRSTLFLAIAALSTSAAACVSSPKPVATIDSAVGGASLSESELAVLRRPPAIIPVVDPGFAGQLTARARWDAYLAGDSSALTTAERRGLILFTRSGCASCHDGLELGGQKYRKLGETVALTTLTDSGRFLTTNDPADLFVFKVASLRNVQLTPPYLHDGSVKTLGQAVRLMSRHQLGVDLTEDQVSDVRAYLTSLTGRVPFAAGDRLPGTGQ